DAPPGLLTMDLSGSRIVAPDVPTAAARPAARARTSRKGRQGMAEEAIATEAVAAFVHAPDERQVASLASLTRMAESYLSEDDVRRVREAYRVADRAHLGQFRSSGEPYISHPIAVAEICAGWKL